MFVCTKCWLQIILLCENTMYSWKKNLPWNNLWDCYHNMNPFVYKKLVLLHHSYGTLIHCNKFLILAISRYWMTTVLRWNIAYTVLDRLVYQKPGLLFNKIKTSRGSNSVRVYNLFLKFCASALLNSTCKSGCSVVKNFFSCYF